MTSDNEIVGDYEPDEVDVHRCVRVEAYVARADKYVALEAQYHELIGKVLALADGWERYGPVFGPVDGTGRPDPDGMFMVDTSRDSLVAELRGLLSDTDLPTYYKTKGEN